MPKQLPLHNEPLSRFRYRFSRSQDIGVVAETDTCDYIIATNNNVSDMHTPLLSPMILIMMHTIR
eukprot:COSAG02_NODE_29080_length_576_cov_1.222222_1_plen_65_part_01